jgi:hypothetical protein
MLKAFEICLHKSHIQPLSRHKAELIHHSHFVIINVSKQMAVFTCCYFIKLNFDADCVYYTSYIFDAVLFLWHTAFALGSRHWYWAGIIWIVCSIFILFMGIFAIVQILTRNTSAASRKVTYIKCRLIVIIGLVVLGIIICILYILYGASVDRPAKGFEFGLNALISYLISAAVLHGYHANFSAV